MSTVMLDTRGPPELHVVPAEHDPEMSAPPTPPSKLVSDAADTTTIARTRISYE
jgi:hypothetical protein